MGEETEYFLQVLKLVNFTQPNLTRITAYALHTVQWKHLQIAIVLDERNIAFILRNIVTETQLLSLNV